MTDLREGGLFAPQPWVASERPIPITVIVESLNDFSKVHGLIDGEN